MSTGLAAHSHSELSPAEVSIYYAKRHPDMVQRGSEWRCWCPRHKGKGPNFAVNAETGLWCCHSQCNCGGSVYDLEMALTNADFPTAAREVRRIIGRPEADRNVDREPEMKWGLPGWSHEFLKDRIANVERHNKWRHTAVYPYFDAESRISYVKVRFLDKQNDKTFRQFGITKNLGWMTRNKAGAKPILYRLNMLAAADEIFIVNGEKAADRGAAELGLAATCTPDGEGNWLGDFTRPLIGKAVRVIIDNDEKGAAHGAVVSAAIVKHVREVKVIRLPGLPPKGDLWDWIEAGGTREQLSQIVANAPVVEPVEPSKVMAPRFIDRARP